MGKINWIHIYTLHKDKFQMIKDYKKIKDEAPPKILEKNTFLQSSIEKDLFNTN